MIQMTFLDDVVHSLLKGENIGITSRRRSRSSQNNSAHSHYTRAQANSPRPVITVGPIAKGSQGMLASHQQNQQPVLQLHQSHHSPVGSGREQRNVRPSRRKGSDSSVPEDDKERREESAVR
ncbi:probable JmjC domain-containing histone demethylation protein 2C, partial [Thalassophryne amazonica]|uniref:probable JmjC domain-containing histone demethylation protein 2C n=1 Tax=Thalassophryne amazonica TaxID=390379 RepID=UPI0014719B5C